MSFINWIQKEGLSNVGQGRDVVFTASEIKVGKYKYVAHCTSYACTGQHDYGSVVKEVRQSTVECPDCKCILYWERIKIN